MRLSPALVFGIESQLQIESRMFSVSYALATYLRNPSHRAELSAIGNWEPVTYDMCCLQQSGHTCDICFANLILKYTSL